MTSLKPRAPYTNEELQKLYPDNLELQLVQVLLRHGERTPVAARFEDHGLPAFWPYCSAVKQLRSVVTDEAGKPNPTFTTLEWKRRLETFGSQDEPQIAEGPGGAIDAICDLGQLTDKGRQTTYQLGSRFRDLYVDRLGFMPKSIASADMFYLRATPIPRALESMQQAFHGMYPAATRETGPDGAPFPAPTIIGRGNSEETLFPNDGNCRRFAALSRTFAQRTADRWNTSEQMEYLDKVIGPFMPLESPRVAIDGHPRLSGVFDTTNATLGHDGPGTRMPKGFYDDKAYRIMQSMNVEEWFGGYRESQEYRTLGIGALMGDVVTRMVGSVEGGRAGSAAVTGAVGPAASTPLKFGMSGCHDTTLASVLASLGALKEEWPPFTSHIAFELFKKKDVAGTTNTAALQTKPGWAASLFSVFSSKKSATGISRKPLEELSPAERSKLDGFYVRVRYNDEVIAIPGCKKLGNHLEGDESLCTLEAFKAIVDKYTPKNWKEQCRMNIGASAFPEKPEPAGY